MGPQSQSVGPSGQGDAESGDSPRRAEYHRGEADSREHTKVSPSLGQLMIGSPRVVILSIVFLAAAVASSDAQVRQERAYVAAGAVWSAQPFEPPYTGPYDFGPGGSAFAWLATIGAMVGPHVGIEVEGASTGMIRGAGASRYYYSVTAERRDQFYGVNMRYIPRRRLWSLQPTVGGCASRRDHAATRTAFRSGASVS